MILAFIPGIGEPVTYAICAAVVTAVVCWFLHAAKIKRHCAEFSTALARQQTKASAALAAAEKAAAEQQAEADRTLKEASLKLADVEQRFATHREVADRRQTDASQQINRLEADLAATRQVAAQLAPTQDRIRDLERALTAEQGRVQAQEQAIQATNARAVDFEKRLAEAQDMVIQHKSEMLETAAELKKVRDEQAAYLTAGGAEAELAKAREALQQAEGRISNLQRALKVAETRVELVQKEFMNAVGLPAAPVGGSMASATSASEKRVRELEDKVTQMESEARRRAREDGYKIAELEYRLAEAREAAKTAESFQGGAPVPGPASSMPASLAPAVLEISPMDAAEEAVPAQASGEPPAVASASQDMDLPAVPAISTDKAAADAE